MDLHLLRRRRAARRPLRHPRLAPAQPAGAERPGRPRPQRRRPRPQRAARPGQGRPGRRQRSRPRSSSPRARSPAPPCRCARPASSSAATPSPRSCSTTTTRRPARPHLPRRRGLGGRGPRLDQRHLPRRHASSPSPTPVEVGSRCGSARPSSSCGGSADAHRPRATPPARTSGWCRSSNEDSGYAGPAPARHRRRHGRARRRRRRQLDRRRRARRGSTARALGGATPPALLEPASADANAELRRADRRRPEPRRHGHHAHRHAAHRRQDRARPHRRLPRVPAARRRAHPDHPGPHVRPEPRRRGPDHRRTRPSTTRSARWSPGCSPAARRRARPVVREARLGDRYLHLLRRPHRLRRARHHRRGPRDGTATPAPPPTGWSTSPCGPAPPTTSPSSSATSSTSPSDAAHDQPQIVGAAADPARAAPGRSRSPRPRRPLPSPARPPAAERGRRRRASPLPRRARLATGRTWLRVAGLLVLVFVVLAGGAYAAYAWSQRQYFVGAAGRRRRHLPGCGPGPRPVALSHIESESDVPVATCPTSTAPRSRTACRPTPSGDAQALVSQLRTEACGARRAGPPVAPATTPAPRRPPPRTSTTTTTTTAPTTPPTTTR